MASIRKNNRQNPFIPGLYSVRPRVRTSVVSRSDAMVITSDGEIQDGCYKAILRENRIDSDDFIKIYPSMLQILSNLSQKAIKVLCYLLSKTDYKDYVSFNIAQARDFTGYRSDTSVYVGISELKAKKIIADHYRQGCYYVNPLYFFRGNRLKLIKTQG